MTDSRHPGESRDLLVAPSTPGPIKTPACAGVTDIAK